MLIDLTAAYDTLWYQGVRVKLQQMLTFNHLINFMIKLLYTWSFPLLQVMDKKAAPLDLKMA